MYKIIESTNIVTNQTSNIRCLIENECPICHVSIMPEMLTSYFLEIPKHYLTVLNFCANCHECFITRYDLEFSYHLDMHAHKAETKEPTSSPYTPKCLDFDEEITNISPEFIKIYNQSYTAEQKGLDEIAGMGYRKALEFLIKDFAISINPKESKSIKSDSLSDCIKKYIDFPELKIVATRAVWLGNDNSHYVKKHTDKDLDDLKTLLTLSIHWIVLRIKTNKAGLIKPK